SPSPLPRPALASGHEALDPGSGPCPASAAGPFPAACRLWPSASPVPRGPAPRRSGRVGRPAAVAGFSAAVARSAPFAGRRSPALAALLRPATVAGTKHGFAYGG